MDKKNRCFTENELGDYPIKDLIEGWFFRVEEISQGFYRVTGIDTYGRSISKDGIDPDELFIACKKEINEMPLDKINDLHS